jgi:DNA mismatch repair protein MutS2
MSNILDKKVLDILEFNKIKKMLVDRCFSDMAKEMAERLVPLFDLNKILIKQKETAEAMDLIIRENYLPIDEIKDIRNIIIRASHHGILSCKELFDIANFLCVSEKIKEYSKNYSGILGKLFLKINLMNDFRDEIKNKIDNDRVLDDASENLFVLRKKIRELLIRLKEDLNYLIRTERNKLSDDVICIRNDRYCLMVKQEYKNSFSGIIHEKSSSGVTFFIEPNKIINLNNKLKELYSEEKQEINKILFDLSNKVNCSLLSQNIYAIGNLDFIFAKAKFAIDFKASMPILNDSGYINLKSARHILIDKNKVVPIDIYIGDKNKFNILLITGPNTGGKTAALKTVGLLVLMAQSGLHITAEKDSEISVFKKIFADIGDEQSIEQNLSTFSAHIKNINFILKNADSNSLILLDEPGAGTDPTEGAALAIAILDYFLKLNSKVIATSHFSELKIHASATNGFENASCEFDIKKLLPTYKLLIGIPGESNAIDIAKKIGLNKEIIFQAKNNLKEKNFKFEKAIKDLEIKQKDIKNKSSKIKNILLEIESEKKKFEDEKNKFELKKEHEINKIKLRAVRIIESAEKKSLELMKNYREQNFKIAEQNKTQIKKLKQDINNYATQNYIKYDNKKNIDIKKIKIGAKVFCRSLNKEAFILSLPDSNNKVLVSIGAFKTKIDLKNISQIKESNIKQESKSNDYANINFLNKSYNISNEINIHGYNVDEAIKKVDKYLDDAILARLKTVKIIHGKGTGVLRKAVWNYLKNNNAIENFRIGDYYEGSLGVTIVELK